MATQMPANDDPHMTPVGIGPIIPSIPIFLKCYAKCKRRAPAIHESCVELKGCQECTKEPRVEPITHGSLRIFRHSNPFADVSNTPTTAPETP